MNKVRDLIRELEMEMYTLLDKGVVSKDLNLTIKYLHGEGHPGFDSGYYPTLYAAVMDFDRLCEDYGV